MSQSWETLVAVALLGTDRQSALPSLGEDGVASLLAQVDAADTEGWVLSAAGTLTAYQRAGQKSLERGGSLFELSDMENSAPCSDACIPFIKTILDSDHQSTLPELLALLQQSGQSIPPEFLPKFLDWGYSHSEVRSQLSHVIGDRGHWLAGLNPKWAYAQATPQSQHPEDWLALWESSDRTVRLNLLREWRLQNPAAARECLATTWKQESAKDRAAFLECLAVGLSLADEAFLEGGLGDRSKEVRAVAVDLLSRLPESQFSQQLVPQVQELVKIREIKGKLKIEVALPVLDDPQWRQYTLDLSLHHTEKYNRASLLRQLMSLVPLSSWAEFGSPDALLAATIKHEWEETLTLGWIFAALQQQNFDWALAGLNWAMVNALDKKGSWKQNSSPLCQLLSILPHDVQQQWIAGQIEPDIWEGEQIHVLSYASLHPWSLQMSAMFLESAQQKLSTLGDLSLTKAQRFLRHIAYTLTERMADILHPNILTESYERVYSHLQTQEFNFLWHKLKFRQQMRQAILEKIEPPG